MEIKLLKNGKLKKISSWTIIILLFLSCNRTHITTFGYLEKPPLMTYNEKEAMNGNFIGVKIIDDSLCYIYTHEQLKYTSSYKKASTGYVFEIKNLKVSDYVFSDVDLDGLGDTLNVRFFDKKNVDIKSILYYGNKKINSYTEYENGKQKITKKYYYNGNIEKVIHWDVKPQFKNARDGVYEEYTSDGKLVLRGHYKNGFRDSLWSNFDTLGNLIKEEYWVDGRYINESGDTIRVLLGEKLDTLFRKKRRNLPVH